MSASNKQRTTRLDSIRDRIERKWGPGTAEEWFRKVVRRPWRPAAEVRPMLTVSDVGQAPDDSARDETARIVALRYTLRIDLTLDWDSESAADEWSNRVQDLWIDLVNYLPGNGTSVHEYRGDEPLDVVIGKGVVSSVWDINMEIRYLVDAGEFGKA